MRSRSVDGSSDRGRDYYPEGGEESEEGKGQLEQEVDLQYSSLEVHVGHDPIPSVRV